MWKSNGGLWEGLEVEKVGEKWYNYNLKNKRKKMETKMCSAFTLTIYALIYYIP